MPDAIGSFSPEAVIEAIEENLVDAAVAMGRTPDGVVLRGNDVAWVYTGFPALNRVLRARFTDDEAEDRVAEISECFHKWNAPVTWVVGPSTWPPQLADYLQESGFARGQTRTGMAVDIRNPLPQPRTPDGLRIELISEPEQFKTWTLLNTEPWPGERTAGAEAIFSPENAGSSPRCRFYLGYLNDRPAVRGMACVKGDIVGLHWIGTPSEHRELDLEIALANRALSDARDAEAKIAVLATVDPGGLLCRTLGFKIFCQFTGYCWPDVPGSAC